MRPAAVASWFRLSQREQIACGIRCNPETEWKHLLSQVGNISEVKTERTSSRARLDSPITAPHSIQTFSFHFSFFWFELMLFIMFWFYYSIHLFFFCVEHPEDFQFYLYKITTFYSMLEMSVTHFTFYLLHVTPPHVSVGNRTRSCLCSAHWRRGRAVRVICQDGFWNDELVL